MPSLESIISLSYIGPGLGAGVVATILGILAAFFLGLFAILWYPFKRMLKGKKKQDPAEEKAKPESKSGDVQ